MEDVDGYDVSKQEESQHVWATENILKCEDKDAGGYFTKDCRQKGDIYMLVNVGYNAEKTSLASKDPVAMFLEIGRNQTVCESTWCQELFY